jgi:hypothetical protein
MKKKDFIGVLEGYITTLRVQPRYYSLGHLTSNEPDVTNDLIHDLAKRYGDDDGVRNAYNKLFDILEVRILACMSSGDLERTTGQSMLKCFHKWDSKVKDDVVLDEYGGMSDDELEKKMEELGWVRR